ncbi:MAG: Rieske (2Fe-2S) protein [Mycobacteriaceae bacterium]
MSDLPRRSVLIGAAVAPLAACSKPADAPVAAHPSTGQTLTAVADVPVGAATIVDGTLITQPSAGVFKGFVARCTHAGCALTVKNGGIQCPCHGSKFALDGSVDHGPAVDPLVARPVTVQGGQIVAG